MAWSGHCAVAGTFKVGGRSRQSGCAAHFVLVVGREVVEQNGGMSGLTGQYEGEGVH